MSDELLEYSARKSSTTVMDDSSSDTPAKKGGLNRLSTIFLVVLGLHVVVIVGISAYHLLRGNPDTPVSHIETSPAPAMEPAKAPEATPAPAVASSMPSPDDKVWQTQAPAEASAPVASAPVPVEAAAPAMAPAAAERTHVVAKGDTLAKIAKANGVTSAALAKANGVQGTMIKIGQKLKIPEVAGAGTEAKPAVSAPAQAVAAAAAKQESSPAGTYTVAAGDTLAKIAKKFGTKAETLAKLNSISDPKKLKIGMKIQVPGEASAKAEAPAAAPAAPAAAQDMAMLPKNSSN
ncbi:MAG: LysM peptidoglycan-binding domain-containing protein [Verrucomicrobia bacterium]|nr:LysM peptidoglycan-binding domain-containing protein [Verrucomicrobiota bacterium]NDD57040.1 LysM peptidoglycan-binding domain-containing protein [Verrucomicrobiota bacterium]